MFVRLYIFGILVLITLIKMSTPFIAGQRLIAFDENGQMIKENEDESLSLEDKSYQVVQSLHRCIVSNDLENFKLIYETQYISDPTVSDYFHFGDQGPYDEYNTYSLCSCENRYDEPEYINKFMSIRPCCCVNGKRYLAYLCAFNAGVANYFHTQYPIENAITPIKKYLLEDGPIDLNHINMVRYDYLV